VRGGRAHSGGGKAGHEGKAGYQEERRWREKMEKWSDILGMRSRCFLYLKSPVHA